MGVAHSQATFSSNMAWEQGYSMIQQYALYSIKVAINMELLSNLSSELEYTAKNWRLI